MTQERMVKLSAVLKIMRQDAEIMREAFKGENDWLLCAEYLDDTANIYENDIDWDKE